MRNKDDKYELAQTAWRFVPMTDLQATRANALIEQGANPSELFSPGQLERRNQALAHPERHQTSLIGKTDIRAAFDHFDREESRSGS